LILVFESVRTNPRPFLVTSVAAAVLLAITPSGRSRDVRWVDGRSRPDAEGDTAFLTRTTPAPPRERGAFGGDLDLLRSFYTPPQVEGESNHYFDLWEPGSLAGFARVQGLTNNRALLIDSHGVSRSAWKGAQYAFRPHGAALGTRGEATQTQTPAQIQTPAPTQARAQSQSQAQALPQPPAYAIADIARVLGPAAADIHNIVIAGCNESGALRSAAFRKYFVNATNVIFMAAGQLAYKPIFFATLSQHSEDVAVLYGRPVADAERPGRMEIFRSRVDGSVPLGGYLADLYLPGGSKPYRRQRAGRELLEPEYLTPASDSGNPRPVGSPIP
jgi:hypothetical protein